MTVEAVKAIAGELTASGPFVFQIYFQGYDIRTLEVRPVSDHGEPSWAIRATVGSQSSKPKVVTLGSHPSSQMSEVNARAWESATEFLHKQGLLRLPVVCQVTRDASGFTVMYEELPRTPGAILWVILDTRFGNPRIRRGD